MQSSSMAWAMANPICRTCDPIADSGAYCGQCAAGIMAKALNPFYGGHRKKLPAEQEKLQTRPRAVSGRTSSQPPLFGPDLTPFPGKRRCRGHQLFGESEQLGPSGDFP